MFIMWLDPWPGPKPESSEALFQKSGAVVTGGVALLIHAGVLAQNPD
jgi:hypothetical protein